MPRSNRLLAAVVVAAALLWQAVAVQAQFIQPSGSSSSLAIGTTPITGGSDTQVLFNDAGTLGGDAGLTFNKTTNVLTNTAGKLLLTGGTVTANSPVIDATQTWNNGAVTFNGIRFNATITAASGSLLLNLQTDGTSVTTIRSDGRIDTGSAYMSSTSFMGFRNNTTVGSSPDVLLARDAANTLAQRNGTNAQTFRVYGSFTDASNGDWLNITKAAGGGAVISTMGNGTGVQNNLSLDAASAGGRIINFRGAGVGLWHFSTAGHFLADTDNTYDIGASGATRPRALYVAGTGIFGGSVTAVNYSTLTTSGYFYIQSRASLQASADGVMNMYNNAGTDFGRLTLGGTTSSFPALGRSTTRLTVGLADGTAGGGVNFSTAAVLSMASGTNQRAGNATLVGGTITVSNTTVTANTVVMLTRKTSGGTLGTAITYTLSAGTSFTITSDSALDTSVFSYVLIEVP